ncbi:hypothetical protein BDN71DRAFT_1430261 [Pleurotus eryngii]|uniref:Uncharacterized protein n=1 Tax=Pleurotus eryngii TaxID=5323 RepID=A0A9P5ZYS8_PLEER|nr:hypothetical protein BDN71DRAFT_1430261 [Pleurotus eryngii]
MSCYPLHNQQPALATKENEPLNASRDPIIPGEFVERNSAMQGDDTAKEGPHTTGNGEERTEDGRSTTGNGEDNPMYSHGLDEDSSNKDIQGWTQERETLWCREVALTARKQKAPREPTLPLVAGPSQSKEKAIDLGNMDQQEQAQMLIYWNMRKARKATPSTGSNTVPLPDNPLDRKSSEIHRHLDELERENQTLRADRRQPSPSRNDHKHK